MARTEENASRGAPAPVIRRLVVAEEDGRTRLMKRQVPAWVISGLIHVVLIAAFIIFDKMTHTDTVAKEETKKPESRLAEDKKEKEADLTIPDENLDSTLVPAVEVERVTEFNVVSPVVESEAVGLPNQDNTPSNLTSNLGDLTKDVGAPGGEATPDGMAMQGLPGSGGQLAMPGLNGRSGATKVALLKQGGGNDKTEAAVGRALIWLAEQQSKSGGFWEFDGTSKADKVAATGMALLPFLAAGETHKTGTRYKSTVGSGLNYLKSQIKPNGQFASSGMYSQAIATIAVCEAAGMTRDETYKKVARLAVDFIIKAQDGDGSWGYSANSPGDTSIVGWQLQALKSAKLADIPVNVKVLDKAIEFLESTSGDSGATYGYRAKGSSHTLTGVGLLCRQYISGWTNRNPFLGRGVDFLWTKFPPREDAFDMYYYYYATQVMHFYEGQVWHRDWNPKMQKILLDKQIYQQPGTKKSDIGSWPKDQSTIGGCCGKLGTTALACLTLEVYYRHLPLYKRDAAGGIAVLEK